MDPTLFHVFGSAVLLRYGSDDVKAPPESDAYLVKIVDEADNLYGFNVQSGVDPKEWGQVVPASPNMIQALVAQAEGNGILYEKRICHHLENYHGLRSPHRFEQTRQLRLEEILATLKQNPKPASFDMAIGVPEEIDFKRGSEEGILGEDNFVSEVKRKTEISSEMQTSIPSLIQAICKHYAITELVVQSSKERYATYVKGVLALLVRDTEGLTLEALGSALNKDANTLGRQAARLFKKAQLDESIRSDIKNLRNSLNKMSYCPA